MLIGHWYLHSSFKNMVILAGNSSKVTESYEIFYWVSPFSQLVFDDGQGYLLNYLGLLTNE